MDYLSYMRPDRLLAATRDYLNAFAPYILTLNIPEGMPQRTPNTQPIYLDFFPSL